MRLPLRLFIPLLILGAALLLVLYLFYFHWTQMQNSIETHARETLRFSMTRTQGTLEYLLRRGDAAQVQEEVAALGSDPALDAAFYAGPDGRIAASIHVADRGRSLQDYVAARFPQARDAILGAAAQARERLHGRVWPGPARQGVFALYPVPVVNETAPARADQVGILFAYRDIGRQQARAHGELVARTAAVALPVIALAVLVGWLLHLRVTRRVEQLVKATRELSEGSYVPDEAFRGGDEISTLFRAFDDMARRIGRSREALLHHRQQLQRQVEARTRELEQANHELEAFSYSVSHDLRAPLRSIDGFSEALMQDCGDRLDDTCTDYLRRIRGATARMAELIDDLLLLARITRQPMQRQRVDLAALARDIVEGLRQQEPERNVEVGIQPDMHAWGDPKLLRVMLTNLLDNAWKYTSQRQSAHIEFGMDGSGGTPVFFVRDDGVGFDPRYLDKLFEPFQRLHGAEFPGNGIGLATVRRILVRHGGRIWAQAGVDAGAVFFFTLPEDDARPSGTPA
ncbi:MAG TPA: sensor histidine kinase [Gammaproteobacteria bacterium]|nr:sensor histidine kinase [Gammaproteobacteria bacterium]